MREYRPDYAVNPINPHLHNVPLQIAAERGIPALAIWLVVRRSSLIAGLWRLFRRGDTRSLAAAGLAAVVAMLAAGCSIQLRRLRIPDDCSWSSSRCRSRRRADVDADAVLLPPVAR